MQEWLSLKQVAELEHITARAVQKKIASYAQTREVKGIGRGGKRIEIHYSCLSAAARERFASQQIVNPTEAAVVDPLAHPEWAMAAMRERLAILNEWQIARAQVKAAHGKVTQAKAEFAAAHGMDAATLFRWEQRYAERGVEGLMGDYHRARPEKRLMTDDLKAVLRKWYLTATRRTAKTCHAYLEQYCAAHQVNCPSYGAAAAFLREITQSEQDLHRRGEAYWRAHHEPTIIRDYSGLYVNELWCGDHRQLDVLCKHPVVIKTRAGAKTVWQLGRPWLTIWLDLKSWCYVGWHLSWQPNGYTIALALRKGMLAFGVPSAVYVDCGKDYRSMYLSNKRISEGMTGRIPYNADTRDFCAANKIAVNPEGILDALGIEIRHAQPVNKLDAFKGGVPRSKPVESSFNWLHAMEQELPGWCGNKPDNMPDATRKLIKGEITAETPLATLDEMRGIVAESIRQHNATPHGDRDRTPEAYYQDAAITVISESQRDALNVLLWRAERKRVVNAQVWLNDVAYTHPELAKWGGESIHLRYDPDDMSRVICMTTGRPAEVICVAENQTLRQLGWHPSAEDVQKYIRAPHKQALQSLADNYAAQDIVHLSDEEMITRGFRKALTDGSPTEPPTPKPPRGGKPKPKPKPESGLQRDNKTYVLAEYRDKKGGASASADAAPPKAATPTANVEKVLPKVYHDAAAAVEQADHRQIEEQQETQRRGRLRHVGGRWVAVG